MSDTQKRQMLSSLSEALLQREGGAESLLAAILQVVETTVEEQVEERLRRFTAPLMKREEVAEHLGVSLRFVDELVSDGALRPVHLGRTVRFDRESVNAYVSQAAHPHVRRALSRKQSRTQR